jgi:hypothetical protein
MSLRWKIGVPIKRIETLKLGNLSRLPWGYQWRIVGVGLIGEYYASDMLGIILFFHYYPLLVHLQNYLFLCRGLATTNIRIIHHTVS